MARNAAADDVVEPALQRVRRVEQRVAVLLQDALGLLGRVLVLRSGDRVCGPARADRFAITPDAISAQQRERGRADPRSGTSEVHARPLLHQDHLDCWQSLPRRGQRRRLRGRRVDPVTRAGSG